MLFVGTYGRNSANHFETGAPISEAKFKSGEPIICKHPSVVILAAFGINFPTYGGALRRTPPEPPWNANLVRAEEKMYQITAQQMLGTSSPGDNLGSVNRDFPKKVKLFL